MKCPKCHYLSFDPEPRCRNCGFDLDGHEASDTATEATGSALDAPPLPELTYERTDALIYEPDVPDLMLHEFRDETEDARPRTDESRETGELGNWGAGEVAGTGELGSWRTEERATAAAEPEEPAVEPEEPAEPAEPVAPVVEPVVPFRSRHTTEMPLFVKGIAERESAAAPATAVALLADDPVVPASGPPLSVRRPAARTYPRRERKPGPIDQDLLEDLRRVEREEAQQTLADARAIAEAAGYGDRALATSRFVAAVIDAGLLGVIAAFVIWGTLRVSEATLAAMGLGAWLPLAAFVVGVGAGYFVLFLASGGQTIGMMLAGIRVVADGPRGRIEDLTLPQAASRAAFAVVAVLPLGLGWAPAMFGGRALHDRLSHTRVVRA